MSPRQRWATVAIFGTAMGYLEAAAVYYLRLMVHRMDPYQPSPLPDIPAIGLPEVAREFATMLMLAAVGCLAGRTWRGRIGFALMTFGIWDITYYLFLIPLTHWPASLFSWDILFLVPLPWWGPVIAPVSIALLFIAFGVLATLLELAEPPLWPTYVANTVSGVGIALALYVFMSDAIAALPGGEAAVRNALPKTFNWALFLPAWIMMAAPVVNMSWQLGTRYR